MLYDKIRQIISKRRKPPLKLEPVKPTKGLMVSVDEYILIQQIKENWREGKALIIFPPNPNKAKYDAAKEVKKGKNLNDIETIIQTGFYVGEE